MAATREARSRFYDGRIYERLIDPLLGGLHGFVAAQVKEGERVVDIGCGTGSLARRMTQASQVLGIELSPAMVELANARLDPADSGRLSFVAGDAQALLDGQIEDYFDVATMVLALHEMPAQARPELLRAAARAARRVLCVDFRVPMPRNLAGLRNRMLEIFAGREHFGAFRDFSARGGIHGLAEAAGLTCAHLRFLDAQTVELCELHR